MDLELTDEQTWLDESLNTLLQREWTGAGSAHTATSAQRDRLWRALVDFGVVGGEGIGAVELCGGWSTEHARTSARPVDGPKLAVEHAAEADRFAVVGTLHGAPALAVV